MIALIFFLLNLGTSLFKPKSRLEAENAALRHQLIVLQRKVRGRVQFTKQRSHLLHPAVSLVPVGPQGHDDHPAKETLLRWHRAGFRRYWRWRSRPSGGRPQIPAELRALIWQMSVDNRLWGAPHRLGAEGRVASV